MANCDTCSYSGCKYSKKLVEALIREVGVKNFIETGTYKGNTTRDVATEFPDVNIQTVELSAQYHQSVKPTLESFKNVKSFLWNSIDFLKNVQLEDGPTLYYLDAHWGDQHPLPEELAIISQRSVGNEIVVIDDFQVPNRPFGYDSTHKGQVYCMSWIDGILDSNNWGYFYKGEQDHPQQATGQVVFFHKNLNLSKFIEYQDGIPYSITSDLTCRASNESGP
jgi:hypothetical protein